MYHSQHTDEVAATRPGPRGGSDVTLVTWGNTAKISEDAVRSLADKGISAEVIDLRTILPWDQQLVFKSIQKTNRALVVHEDTITMGFGAEISARIMEEAFESLDAPVRRVTATCPPKLQRRWKDSFCPTSPARFSFSGGVIRSKTACYRRRIKLSKP
jgi:2-oxoisovalerate dehydrogenase E1 component